MKKTLLLLSLFVHCLVSAAQPSFNSKATFWFKLCFAGVHAMDEAHAGSVQITGATRYRYIKQYDLFQIELDIHGTDPSIRDFPHSKFLQDVTIIYEGKKVLISKHELSEYEDLPVMIYSDDLNLDNKLIAWSGINNMGFHCYLPVLKDTLHPATIFPRLIYFEATEGMKVCEPPYGEMSSSLRMIESLDDSGLMYIIEQHILTNGCLPSNSIYFEGPLQLLYNYPLKIRIVTPHEQTTIYDVNLNTVYIDYKRDIGSWIMCKE